jgi:hypothetical protein
MDLIALALRQERGKQRGNIAAGRPEAPIELLQGPDLLLRKKALEPLGFL